MVDSKPAVVLGPQVTPPRVYHTRVCITCQGTQCLSPPQCPLTWSFIRLSSKNEHPLPIPAVVSLSGEWSEGTLQTQVTAPSPMSSRPVCFSHPFYRLVPLGIPLGCTHSSSCQVKNTPLSLIIHPCRSRQDFDLKGISRDMVT